MVYAKYKCPTLDNLQQDLCSEKLGVFHAESSLENIPKPAILSVPEFLLPGYLCDVNGCLTHFFQVVNDI